MRELVCIVCPRGCRLRVDEEMDYAVTGNRCRRGAEYGRNECRDPRRVLTSTVRVTGAYLRRCPVKTDRPVPKGMQLEIMGLLDGVTLAAPVQLGQVILRDVDGLGANVVATKTVG